jgi:formylmethanofuran dehydrogenase subunit E
MNKFASYEQVVKFHGHSCPGLAMGYRLTLAALEFLKVTRAEDEELIVIVENDACGTDAVQYVSGCTFGKGNFIFRDLGKMAYSFYNRKNSRSVRITRKNSFRNKLDQLELNRKEKIEHILKCPLEDLVEYKDTYFPLPVKAELYNNEICSYCGESVMETRIIEFENNKLCRTCFENRS